MTGPLLISLHIIRNVAVSALLLSFAIPLSAQLNLDWAFSVGTPDLQGYGQSDVFHVTDSSGNIYITARYPDVIDFDPSIVNQSIFSNGGQQPFIAKYDKSGNYLWAKNIPETPGIIISCMAVDNNMDIVVSGMLTQLTDFDPSMSVYSLSPAGVNNTAFLAKYNSMGDLIWAKKYSSTDYNKPVKLITDSGNNIYAVGYFTDSINFDTGSGASWAEVDYGTYISKYDLNGEHVWGGAIDSLHVDNNVSLTVDDSSLYVINKAFSSIDADMSPSGQFLLPSNGTKDHVGIKYRLSTGEFEWAFRVGGNGMDEGGCVAVDDQNIYLGGNFIGTMLNINLTDSNDYMASINGESNVFLASYDKQDLTFNWGRRIVASEGGATIGGIGLSDNGILVAGRYRGITDFDPSGGTYELAPSSWESTFVASYTKQDCSLSWVSDSDDSHDFNSFTYAKSAKRSVFCGVFIDTIDVDFEVGVTNLISSGNKNMYLATHSNLATSINATDNKRFNFNVYPNPTTDILYIRTKSPETLHYAIFDGLGRMIKMSCFVGPGSIRTSLLTPGVYYLRLRNEASIETLPFIKTNP